MSNFGYKTNSGHNLFAVNTNGNASTSGFGNLTNSAHNQFAANSTGNGSMSVFEISNNSASNPFASNTNSNASMSAFGNMTNLTHNPFAVNATGNASMSASGIPKNPFASNSNSNASLSAFGNMTNATRNPFAVNSTGNASAPVFKNPNPFGVKPPQNLPNTNNSTCNPFAGNTTSPSFTYQRITFDGTSTGQFGLHPTSAPTSPLPFGVPAAPSKTSDSPAAFTNPMHNNAFGWGPGGSAPASFLQSSGPKFGQPTNALFGTKGPMTSTSAGTNKSVSNSGLFSVGTTKSYRNPSFSFGVPQASTGLNKGSMIKPYAATKNAENIKEQKFLSISSMPVYESKCHEELRWEDYELKSGGTSSLQSPFNTVSTGSSVSPVSQFPKFTPISPTSENPFSRTPIPSWNITPSSTTTATSLSNSGPSSTTIPASTHPSPPFLITPIEAPPSNPTPSTNTTSWFNPTPSTNITSRFNQPSPFVRDIYFPSSTPPSPSPTQPSNSTAPPFIQVNPPSNLTSPLTSTPWPYTQPATLTEIGKSQINPAPSTSASQTFPGNHGDSTDKVVDCIIAVQDPFGSQSVSSHPLIDHRICSPLIQNGISGMPVIDKPATTRISSLVTARHLSQRPLTVRSRKYNPKSDRPKVPFFDLTDEIPHTQKESTCLIPRENPRSAFEATPKLSSFSCAKVDVTDASTSLHDGGLESKTDQASSSTLCDLECQKSINQKWQQVNPSASVPKLHGPDYYTQPSIQELRSAESYDPDFCSHVQDFVVGRHGYGEIKFEGETDVRGLDLDALVHFNKREVIVYNEEHEKPKIGEGLNKRAEITLLNVKCSDKSGKEYKSGKMVDMFVVKLNKVAEDQGAEFVSYDAVNGVWKFQVQHF